MTTREFYNKIAALQNIDAELTEFAASAIEKMDNQNEARRAKGAEKAAAKQAEKAPIRAALFAVMTDEPKTASMLIDEAELDIKPASVPSLLRPLVEAGEVLKVDVKITGKGTQRGYVKA